jgi:surface carbohydrate biosynthesis protein (TIGR04326 family)
MRGGVSQAVFSELWVCFELPAQDPPAQALVLSFLAPGAETEMEDRWGPRIVSGRALVQEVRSRARAEYLRLIARTGATPCVGGRTLRQALQGPGNYSRWWFLGVTEKDCFWDEDTIYLTVLQLMAVRDLCERYRLERVRLHGAVPAFAAALGQRAPTRGAVADLAGALALGLLGRLRLLVEYVGMWWTLRRLPLPAGEHRDVLLQGYWDWTVRPENQGGLRDRYFTDLPAELAGRGLSVGWLASCELDSEPWRRGRKRHDVLAASSGYPEVTLLERYLTPGDILRTVCDLRYPVHLTRAVSGRAFRRLCSVGGFDLYPLVRRQLLRSGWNSTVCRLQLVAMATARACRHLRPMVVLTSFELFLRSRALYAGVRACSPRARVWAAQHAAYSSDKTLGVFDPDIEVRGTPDGCAVPAPDGIFVMGDLSRRIWEGNGFAGESVVLTGGLRYQAVGIEPRVAEAAGGHITLLLAGGMCEAAHVDLCAAALSATSGLGSVRLHWRDHPHYSFSRSRSFRRFRGSITVTSCPLDEDLQAADLVLFSQTGLAEEALLRGIPTWQWLWPGFNASPFLDVPVIPSFTSVSALRRELQAFMQDPERYQPTVEVQRRVLYECFGPDPAGASARIADAIQHMITADARAHA